MVCVYIELGAFLAILGLTGLLCFALLELDTIVTPERDTYEHIDDVLRAFIDLAARHKRTSCFHFERKRRSCGLLLRESGCARTHHLRKKGKRE
jgi:hypothetical protein